MESIKSKTIYILLTEHTDFIARLYRLLTGHRYTHASIGMEDYGKRYFSFGIKKGFRVEMPWLYTKFKKKGEACALYHLEVTEERYADVKERLEEFKKNRKQYHYSFLSAALCFLRIPHHFKNGYFCSEFVADILSSSDAVQLSKRPSLYHPGDFANEPQLSLCFQGTLTEFAESC